MAPIWKTNLKGGKGEDGVQLDPCQFVQIYQVGKKKYLLPALDEIVYLLNVTCLCRKV